MAEEEKSLLLVNICLIPDPETLAHAVAMNRRFAAVRDDDPVVLGLSSFQRELVCRDPVALRELGGVGAADSAGTYPHITLLQRRIRRTDWIEASLAVRGVVRETARQQVFLHNGLAGGFQGYDVALPWVMRKVTPSKTLIWLHQELLKCMRPFSEGIAQPNENYIGARFNPHLTIATVNEAGRDAAERLPRTLLTTGYWFASQIALGELGARGTVTRILACTSLRETAPTHIAALF